MQNTHLRTYVKKHPDNKMAWYLLGKEYLGEGQEAKANYCFQQAGEVYEAFERSKAPADIWVDYQEKLVEMSEQRRENNVDAKCGLRCSCCLCWQVCHLRTLRVSVGKQLTHCQPHWNPRMTSKRL